MILFLNVIIVIVTINIVIIITEVYLCFKNNEFSEATDNTIIALLFLLFSVLISRCC